MNTRARRFTRKTLLACAALAAGVPAGVLAQANALNPSPLVPPTAGRWMDEEAMGTRFPSARSPTGRLYEIPLDPDGEADPKAGGWQLWSFAELGVLHATGDAGAQGFRAYRDPGDGFLLNAIGFAAERPDRALYFEAAVVAAGRDDQSWRLRAGRHNDWRVSAFFDGVPYAYTTTYRALWDGVGTGDLRLRGLAPGGAATPAATRANVLEVLSGTGESALEVQRNKAGVRIDKHLSDAWKAYASFTDERREGARPFGAVFGGGGGGGNMEVAESIDYATRDFVAGLQFNDPVSSFNLRASASFFRNDIPAMAFENPLAISLNGSGGLAPSQFTHGRFALPPDNQHYNVKGEYARSLPFLRGQLKASVALGWMRQDEDLLAPTDQSLAGGTVSAGGASLENAWNTPASLSRDSADARLDTRLVDLGLLLKPAAGLDVRGKVRYFETRNASQYLACNPLSGQWGRLLNEGSGLALAGAHTMSRVNPAGTSANAFNAAGCDLEAAQALGLVPAAGNIPIAAIPNDYRRLDAGVAADYRLGRAASVNAELAHETVDRDFREREQTRENRFKLAYVNRGAIAGTIRLAYEHARRGGSDYDPNASAAFRSAALGPLPANGSPAVASWFQGPAQFRSFDLADRRQDVLSGRIDYALRQDADIALTVRHRDADYPAEYGRTGAERSSAVVLDLTYEAGPAAVLYGFYSHQSGRMRQKGLQPNACALGYTYYFYSNGRVLSTLTGAAAPNAPAGTTLVASRDVTAGNWNALCGVAAATSPLYPESRAWDVDSRERNHALGFGLRYDFGKVRLDTSFSRALSRTRIGYAFNPDALGIGDEAAALAGGGLADLVFAQNVLDASLQVPIDRRFAVRLLVRHERGRVRDWHHDGVADNPMPANNALYLDGGPRDWRATLIGIFFQARL